MGNYDNVSRDVLRRMLESAAAIGHTLQLEHRPGPGNHELYWVRCSCGYLSTSRRSVSATLGTLAWHAGGALGEGSRNGVQPPQPPATRRSETPSREPAGL